MSLLIKCCECQRIRLNNAWIPEHEVPVADALFSHGYCPECLDKMMAQVEAWDPALDLKFGRRPLNLDPVLGG